MGNSQPMEQIKDKAIGAMLGTACGDALGWPNERMARSKSKMESLTPRPDFTNWTRQTGGRYYRHGELIQAGEYSDDTQLIMCLSRCLKRGEAWWSYWTSVELPFWRSYERGGGSATKHAADTWLDRNPPWSSKRDARYIKRYFEAGGNGVAMRVLPHVLYHSDSKEYEVIAYNIMLDGIATHGHPRALVGALAYGYALWKTLRREDRLGYGEITSDLLDSSIEWSSLPNLSDKHPDWSKAADNTLSRYSEVWYKTVEEMRSLLSICRDELNKGASNIDDETLQILGCFDNKVSGSGTITAAAAIFLASRYAPDPIHGIVKAAFSSGADTDTIAAMTGGLLGIISGSSWLALLTDKVQNSSYLMNTAENLMIQTAQGSQSETLPTVNRAILKNWTENLITQADQACIILPDGRHGTIYDVSNLISAGSRLKINMKKVVCEDGQELFFKKISRAASSSTSNTHNKNQRMEKKSNLATKELNFGAKVPVESFEDSLQFYRDILGFSIKKESSEIIVFDQGLVLIPTEYCENQLENSQLRTLLYIEVDEIEKKYTKIKELDLRIMTSLGNWGKTSRLFFRCLDPDGNILEVFSTEQ